MRILHVIDQIGIQHGGSAVVPRKLSKAQEAMGHDVTIYASSAGINSDLPSVVGLRSFKSINFVIQLTPTMMFADFRNYDVIHCHNYYHFPNLIARFRNINIPMVLNPHGTFIMYELNDGKVGYITDRLWRLWFLKRMDKVICVSDIEVEQSKKLGLSKLVRIPNGIDLDDYNDLPPQGYFRTRYNIGDDTKIVLYLGRGHWMKGLDVLKKAFRKLQRYVKNICLVIVGASDEIDYSGDGIIEIPPIYGINKLSAYVDADVFVLPSLYEIFGITALEASACGTPVIISDKCGIADYCDNRTGEPFVVSHNDLWFSILKEFEHPTKSFYKSQRMAFAAQFSWGLITEKILEVYRGLVG